MEFALQIVAWAVGMPLEILIISALFRGLRDRFPFLFVYVIALFVTTVVEIPFYVDYYFGKKFGHSTRADVYWVNEVILIALIALVVLSLIWRASSAMPTRRVLRVWLIAGPAVGAAVSLWVHYDAHAERGEWMTPWTRDVYFGAAILDLALWMLLLVARDKDRLVLLLSGALGIQFAGEATGGSLRDLSVAIFGAAAKTRGHAVAFAGNIIIMLANLACLYLWSKALRRAPPSAHNLRIDPY